jgi:formylglycine-generating enzyme required for sulfatase activity
VIELGTHHEQQHQELILTDVKHLLAQNPLAPIYRESGPHPRANGDARGALRRVPGGVCEVGHAGAGFAFDNEGPRHRVYLEPFALASRPVTNREYLAFVDAGGYRDPEPWLADGWAAVQRHGWEAPLYWQRREGAWWYVHARRPARGRARRAGRARVVLRGGRVRALVGRAAADRDGVGGAPHPRRTGSRS